MWMEWIIEVKVCQFSRVITEYAGQSEPTQRKARGRVGRYAKSGNYVSVSSASTLLIVQAKGKSKLSYIPSSKRVRAVNNELITLLVDTASVPPVMWAVGQVGIKE